MAVNRTHPSPLAFIAAAMLLATAVAGVGAAGPNVKVWVSALREPFTLEPVLPTPLPLLLLALLLPLTALAVGRTLSGRGASRALAGGVYLVGLGLVFLRLFAGPFVPAPASKAEADRLTGEVLEGLSARLDDAHRRSGRLPDPAAVAGLLGEHESPFRSHARALVYRVVAEEGVGARLRGRAGDLPGTVYCVVDPSRTRYWLTAVVVDGAPTGVLDFLRDAEGAPRIVRSPVRGHAPERGAPGR